MPFTAEFPFRLTEWTIEVSNLPPKTDEPALRDLLTSRRNRQGTGSESSISTRRSLKRQLSFKLSFASERDMQEAIDCLN